MSGELFDGLIHWRSGGNHQPHDPRSLELRDHFLQRVRAHGALGRESLHHGRIAVESHNAMAALDEPFRHEPAHFPQTNHSQFHKFSS